MGIQALTQPEQKYTYAQSMQLEGQTGCVGHFRGDFAPLDMTFIPLGLTLGSNVNPTSPIQIWTKLSICSVKIRGCFTTVMIWVHMRKNSPKVR